MLCRYHSSRYYGIQSTATIKADNAPFGLQISKNVGIITLAAADPSKYYSNLKVTYERTSLSASSF